MLRHGLQFNFKGVGMKDTKYIDFKTLLEYYMNEGCMTLPKQQLEMQMRDLLTILDFIEKRVPFKMKFIKKKIDDYNNDILKWKKALSIITATPSIEESGDRLPSARYNQNINSAYLAYSQLAQFGRKNKESSIDYENRIIQEIRIKFLESEGLPSTKRWSEMFRSSEGTLHITYKKYLAVVGLRLHGERCCWNLESIKDSVLQKMLWHQVSFFFQYIEQLKATTKQECEHLYLATVFKFLHRLEMLEVRAYLQNLPASLLKKEEQEGGKEVFQYRNPEQGLELAFTFSQLKEEAVKMTIKNERLCSRIEGKFEKSRAIIMKLIWRENSIVGELSYSDIDLRLRENMEHISLEDLIDMMADVEEVAENYDNFKRKYEGHKINQMKDYMFWKVNNYHWYYDQNRHPHSHTLSGSNGIYLSHAVEVDPLVIHIMQNSKFDFKYAPHSFIEKLVRSATDLKVIFIFLEIIRCLAYNEIGEGCEIDDFGISEGKVWLDLKQKIVYEDNTIKINREPVDDKSQFTSMACMVRFDLSFTNMELLSIHTNPIRDPTPIQLTIHSTERWRDYQNEKKSHERLRIAEVKAFLYTFKSHYMIKRIYDRRLQENNRAIFRLCF